jgi:hypothetical protein
MLSKTLQEAGTAIYAQTPSETPNVNAEPQSRNQGPDAKSPEADSRDRVIDAEFEETR